MSEGVWLLPGGSQSVVVEFRDHLVVLDAPVDEQRSRPPSTRSARSCRASRSATWSNTHLHFDHVGGLRTYAAEGAIIITQRDNIAYFETVWANRRTINPDRLATSSRSERSRAWSARAP